MDICSSSITALGAAKIVSAIFFVPIILLFVILVFWWGFKLFRGDDKDLGLWLVTTLVVGFVATLYTFFLFF